MIDDGVDEGRFSFDDSLGSRPIEKALKRMIEKDQLLLDITQSAQDGIDLGSGSGESALALSKLCPNLRTLHCVDHRNRLVSPFKEALSAVAQEHRMTMQNFMKTMVESGEQVDVVMITSVQDLTRFQTPDLVNLAKIIKQEGVIFEIAPNASLDTQVQMEDFFHLVGSEVKSSGSINIWQRNGE